MLRDATPADLPSLRALFARASNAPYDLQQVAEEKCFGRGVAGETRVRVAMRGETIAGVAVTCGKYLRILAVDPDARRQGLGTALLEDSGASVVAAEAGNYFTPGVWDGDRETMAFLEARGYRQGDTTDNLEVALTAPYPITNTRRPAHDEAGRVLSFVEQRFGRIWRFEAAKAFETATPQIFVAEEEGALAGFAVHDVNNRGLGFFGPTGVAKELRGRGLGCALLLASLGDLRRLGYSRAVIPWTDALAFYRKCCGAEPAHRFITYLRK